MELKSGLLEHLEQIAFFLEMQGANAFRIRAYASAIEVLDGLESSEIELRIRNGTLTELDRIGKGIAAICESFAQTQSSQELTEARGKLPLSLFELKQIPGLGPKKILELNKKLQITALGELEYACSQNRVSEIKGLGEKMQKKILQSLQELKMKQGKFLLPDALEQAELFETTIPPSFHFHRVGELGQKLEIISHFDYLIESPLQDLKKVKGLKVLTSKEDVAEAQIPSGLRLRFFSCDEKESAVRSVYLTSSEKHWKSLQLAAEGKSYELSKSALLKNNKVVSLGSDRELYQVLGLNYREAFEREMPSSPQKNENLCRFEDLTGVFHFHTKASDGTNSLEEMTEAAIAHGWKFMGLSDHSQTAFYANGLTEEALEEQWEEVDRLHKKFPGFRILRGVESDILKDGSLDYPSSFLKKLDFVIASIHSRYGMTEMTDRLLAAIENPHTTIMGHLTGRLLLAREGYEVDHEKVIAAAIKHNKVIELNSHPHRLDIDWRYLADACSRGLLISIDPDAHSAKGFDHVKYGVSMARKAGVPKENILNAWPLEKILKYLKIK